MTSKDLKTHRVFIILIFFFCFSDYKLEEVDVFLVKNANFLWPVRKFFWKFYKKILLLFQFFILNPNLFQFDLSCQIPNFFKWTEPHKSKYAKLQGPPLKIFIKKIEYKINFFSLLFLKLFQIKMLKIFFATWLQFWTALTLLKKP